MEIEPVLAEAMGWRFAKGMPALMRNERGNTSSPGRTAFGHAAGREHQGQRRMNELPGSLQWGTANWRMQRFAPPDARGRFSKHGTCHIGGGRRASFRSPIATTVLLSVLFLLPWEDSGKDLQKWP
jgi:hypothetical protein